MLTMRKSVVTAFGDPGEIVSDYLRITQGFARPADGVLLYLAHAVAHRQPASDVRADRILADRATRI